MTLGTDIYNKRKRLNYTQKQLAEEIGLKHYGDRTIRRWENGETSPSTPEYNMIMGLEEKVPFSNPPDAEFKMIDLFAGIGGTRLGFYFTSKVRSVFSSEIDKYAVKTYSANFGDKPVGDITKIPSDEIPDHDILVGGFPCQAFSIAGKRLGFEDTRGTLFFEIARILKAKRPRAFLLENVRNLVSHDHGNTFKTIINTLNELDYKVYYSLLKARDFGVPQNRERIFIVGFDKKTVEKHGDFKFPEPQSHAGTKVGNILEKDVDDRYTISDNLWAGHKRRKIQNKKDGKGFGYCLFNKDSEYTSTISARYYKDGSEILIEQKGKNPRKITPREAARLQGFPDDYIIPVSDTQAYKEFGNSVAVPVIRAIAQEMLKVLG